MRLRSCTHRGKSLVGINFEGKHGRPFSQGLEGNGNNGQHPAATTTARKQAPPTRTQPALASNAREARDASATSLTRIATREDSLYRKRSNKANEHKAAPERQRARTVQYGGHRCQRGRTVGVAPRKPSRRVPATLHRATAPRRPPPGQGEPYRREQLAASFAENRRPFPKILPPCPQAPLRTREPRSRTAPAATGRTTTAPTAYPTATVPYRSPRRKTPPQARQRAL